MVQMKITASILIAAAAIGPAVAYGFEGEDSLVTRDDNEFAGAYGRGLDLDLDEREFDEELYERERFRGMGRGTKKMFPGGSRHRHGLSAPSTPTTETQNESREFDDDLLEREFDEELYERERFRGMGRGAKRMFPGGSRHRHGLSAPSTPTTETQNESREFDDDLLDREFDEELYERERFRGMGRGTKKMFPGGSRHRHGLSAPSTPTTETQNESREFDDDLLEREFDEGLYERERFRGMGRGAKKMFPGGSRHRHGLSAPSTPTTDTQTETRGFDDELMEREFDDELFGREYDSELFEREPEPFFGFLKRLFNKKKAPAPDAEAVTTDARDFDELD